MGYRKLRFELPFILLSYVLRIACGCGVMYYMKSTIYIGLVRLKHNFVAQVMLSYNTCELGESYKCTASAIVPAGYLN